MQACNRRPPSGLAALILGMSACSLLSTGETLPARGELDSAALVEKLQAWLDGTRDLQGAFEQTMLSGALGSGLAESGRLYVERPGRMRWDYLKPERKIALLDGGRTWLYIEEEKEVILGRLEEDSDLLPELLTGEGRIAERFLASVRATPGGEGEGSYHLRLAPRGESEPFEEVVLALRPPEFAIEALEVLDAAGNRMVYRFSALRRNQGLPRGLFQFEPPSGTSVLGTH